MALYMFLECLKNWMSISMEDSRTYQRSVWRRSDVLLKISAMVSIRYLRGYVMGLLKSVWC